MTMFLVLFAATPLAIMVTFTSTEETDTLVSRSEEPVVSVVPPCQRFSRFGASSGSSVPGLGSVPVQTVRFVASCHEEPP